jgi:glycosyltransferase involved in cell wall biosynthesis
VIAADLPGMAEAVPTGRGALFPPGDSRSLRDKLAETVREIGERGGRRLPPDLSIPSLPNQFADFRNTYARLAGEPADDRPTLSVLVPAFNEKATLEEALARVKASPVDKEIIVVDDGSSDGTREVLRRLAAEADEIEVAFHERNTGKGAAIRTAIDLARGRIAIVQDADLEYDPQDYPALIAPILAGETKVVYGSRPKCPENDYPLDLFRLGSYLMTAAASLLYTCRLSDEPTCYKVFDMDLLKSIDLRCTGFEFCPEVTAKVRKKGERIVEIPIRYYKRSVEEGKKIKARDLFVGLWTLLKYRFID